MTHINRLAAWWLTRKGYSIVDPPQHFGWKLVENPSIRPGEWYLQHPKTGERYYPGKDAQR